MSHEATFQINGKPLLSVPEFWVIEGLRILAEEQRYYGLVKREMERKFREP